MRGLLKATLLVVGFLALAGSPGHAETVLIYPDGWESDAGFQLAIADLTAAFTRHAQEMRTVPASRLDARRVPPDSIVTGPDNPIVARWVTEGRLILPPLEGDDHLIRSLPVAGGRALVVIGGTLRGSLYGLFYLAERLAIDPEAAWRTTTLRHPAFSLRLVSGETPEQALQLGYNAVYLNAAGIAGEATLAATLSEWDATLAPSDGPLDRAIHRHRVMMTKMAEKIASLHLDNYGGGREPEFPTALLSSDKASTLTHSTDPDELCLSKPGTWQFLAAKYADAKPILSLFQGYIVQAATRAYSSTDGLFAATPAWEVPGPGFPARLSNGCRACRRTTYEDRVADLVKSLRAMVRRQGVTRFIYRASQPSSVLMHADPELYRRIVGRLRDTDGLWIALKATRTDFWDYAFPNPCLGVGKVAQMVEFDCERRYEGHGAWPAFEGSRAVQTYRLCRARGVDAIWNHHRSLTMAPRPTTDIWTRANAYVAAHLLWDPDADPRELARDWAALEVAPDASEPLAAVLELSERTVHKWRYVEPYSRRRDGYLPAAGLLEGDVLGGQSVLETLYAAVPFEVDRIIVEKAEALGLVDRMLERLEACRDAIDSSPLEGLSRRFEPPPLLDPREPLAFARFLATGDRFGRKRGEVESSGRVTGEACRPLPCRLVARLPSEQAGRYTLRLVYDRPLHGSVRRIQSRELQDRLFEVTSEPPEAPRPAVVYHHYRRDDFEVRLLFESPRSVALGDEAYAAITVTAINTLGDDDWIEPHLSAIEHDTGKVIDIELTNTGRVDASLFNTMKRSVEHLRSVVSLLHDGISAYLLDRRFHDTEDTEDRGQALAHADRFRKEVKRYRDQVSLASGSPSGLDISPLEEIVEHLRDKLERAMPSPDGWSTMEVLAGAGLEGKAGQWSDSLDQQVRDAGRLGRLRRAALGQPTDHRAYRRKVSASFLSVIGGLPRRTDLAHRESDPILATGYLVRRVLFESRPGFYVTANVYEPSGLTDRPAIVLCCDEGTEGKAAPEIQTLAVALVRRGYVVAVPDPLGEGERRESYDPTAGRAIVEPPRLERSIVALDFELVGWRLERDLAWDLVRMIDYLCARRTVDHARIAVAGLGRGALLAADTALIDERIAATILVDPPAGLADSLSSGFADSPLSAMAGALRPASPIDWPDRLAALIPRRVWAVLPAPAKNGEAGLSVESLERLCSNIGQESCWHLTRTNEPGPFGPPVRETILSALVESFGRTPEPLEDVARVARSPEELRCTTTGQIASSIASQTSARLHAVGQAESLRRERRGRSEPGRAERVARLMALAGVERPGDSAIMKVISSTRRDELRLERVVIDREGDQPLPGILILPAGREDSSALPATIYLSDKGKALACAPGGAAELLARRNRVVLALDVRGTGELAPRFGSPADLAGGYQALVFGSKATLARRAFLVGSTFVGLQAGDILAATSALRERHEIAPQAVSLHACGDLTVPATIAAVIDEGVAGVTLEGGLACYESVLESDLFEVSPALFIPDILRHEDLPELLGLVAPRPAKVIAPIDGRRRLLDENTLREIFAPTLEAYGYLDAPGRLQIERTAGPDPEARQ